MINIKINFRLKFYIDSTSDFKFENRNSAQEYEIWGEGGGGVYNVCSK